MTTGLALLGLQANEAVHNLFCTDGNTIGQPFRQFADIEILQDVEESRTGLLLIVVQGVVEIRSIDGLGSECETIDHGIAARDHPSCCKTGGKGDDDAHGEEPPEQPGEVVLHHPLRGQNERRLGENDAYRQPNPILGDIYRAIVEQKGKRQQSGTENRDGLAGEVYQVLIASETPKQQLRRQSHHQTDDAHASNDDKQAAADDHAIAAKVFLAQEGHAERLHGEDDTHRNQ